LPAKVRLSGAGQEKGGAAHYGYIRRMASAWDCKYRFYRGSRGICNHPGVCQQAREKAMAYPHGAPRIYCCFDQSDLRAVFTVSISAPQGWSCFANAPLISRPAQGQPGSWRFARTAPIAPWLTSLCAGPLSGSAFACERDGSGAAKACVVAGNTQLKVYHKLLSSPGMRHQDLGPDYYERQASIRRQIAHHVGKLGSLGFEVTLCRIPGSEPDPDPEGQTQAA
jgi:hypothetical protein